MSRLTVTKSKPTVVVGLDFGTTFSGFAYALVSDPSIVSAYYEWPELRAAGGSNYCKTPTSLLYVNGRGTPADSYVLEDWAYAAIVKHGNNRVNQPRLISGSSDDGSVSEGPSGPSCHAFITRFKLLLADPDSFAGKPHVKLPKGLTARTTISDYLHRLSALILDVLQKNLGTHIVMEDIQWCLTVPAIWDERAKQEMKACAEIAGLIQGPHCSDEEASPHPMIIVLEPEAASVYCQQKVEFPLHNGDKFLVVDVGGGTVDLVLHEKVGDLKVREVSPSSGGLCGGTFVDQNFLEFLSEKIKCFPKFSGDNPQSLLRINSWWETVKHGFDGEKFCTYELELPAKLARAWEADEKSRNSRSIDSSFDVIDLSLEDMRSIFDPVVDQILKLIEDRMIQGLRIMMVVGGFSGSPYLLKRIKLAFSDRVEAIVVPKEPGSAICCGAVSYGITGDDIVMSRISKKTYGISLCRLFLTGDPVHLAMSGPGERPYCSGVFEVFVRNGHGVAVDQCVSRSFAATFSDQTETEVCLYSSSESDPKYVDDSGVKKEGSFIIKHPSGQELGTIPKFRVSLFFGRTSIEVKAVGRNFGNGEDFVMPAVTFEKSFE